MEEKLYTIMLEDGTTINDLYLNGNNFISQTKLTQEVFEGRLGTVTISDGEYEETHHNMELVQITETDGEYWFVLIDIPKSQLENSKIRSDVDYLAMMSGIEF